MNIYVARQAVFDTKKAVFGYELLYRSSSVNRYSPEIDDSSATCILLANVENEFGLESLIGGGYAFVNFTRELLKDKYVRLLDPKRYIIEILENVEPDETLLGQLTKLKEMGFLLALDDYAGDPRQDKLVEISDILKVDFKLTTPEGRLRIAERYLPEKRLLAEKVETEEEVETARRAGYSLFQGYYFSKPIMVSKTVYEMAAASYVRLWRAIQRPTPNFDELTEIIRLDVNLSYKLLARANTLMYYRGHRVGSVKQAIVQMGLGELRRWTLATLLRGIISEKSNEPAKRALIRATFSEKLAWRLNKDDLGEDAFTVGMFSTLDVGSGLQNLFDKLRIPGRVGEALRGEKGVLNDILQFVKIYEEGRWEDLSYFEEIYRVPKSAAIAMYLESVDYAERVFGSPEVLPPMPYTDARKGALRLLSEMNEIKPPHKPEKQ